MTIRAAFATGTVLSVAAVSAWALSATLTMGPPAPLVLTRDLPADYAALAAAPFGSGAGLFALTAVIYFTCFTVSGLRHIRREHREDGA